MSGSVRLAVVLLVSVFVGYFVLKIVSALVFHLLSLLIPIGIIGGVAYVLYMVISRKSLTGGRRLLP